MRVSSIVAPLIRPRTDDQLHRWIQYYLGWTIPCDVACPDRGHVAAFEFIARAFANDLPGGSGVYVAGCAFGLQRAELGGRQQGKGERDGGARAEGVDVAYALLRENHTLKRLLTDPTILSGIGNAYSDEILHRARLSPVKLSRQLSDEEIGRLCEATRSTLVDWIERLRRAAGTEFPEGVTAFREGMAVHGRYGKPCPACGLPVQRIVYAENETNYCAGCQTGGRLMADRALSRLFREDWPRTVEELEERRRGSTSVPGEVASPIRPQEDAAMHER